MSKIMKVVLVLSLALILSVALFGCAGEEAAQGELTQEELEQIVADAAIATEGVDTTRFDMNMLMVMDMIAEGEPVRMTIGVDGTGAVDNTGREMRMIMDMDMDIPELGEQEMATDVYVVGGWMYMKLDVPVIGEQWMKMALTEEIWQSQSQVDPQIELLVSAMEVRLLGSENIRGVPCYVVEIVPEMGILGNLLSQQQGMTGMEGIDLGQLNLADLFKEMSVKVWIAEDSHFLAKSEINVLIEVSAGDVGGAEGDFEEITLDMTVGMELYDYNQGVSIELPEAALQAVEMPGL